MKKRTNSQSASNTPTHSKTVSASNVNSQNYLHMLKQTSSAFKANKTIGLTKPEPLSSFLKTTNMRTPGSNRSDSNLATAFKAHNLFASMTPTASSQKQGNSSTAFDFRSMNFRDNQKADAKMPLAPRNNSEPRLKNSLVKQLNLSQQKPHSGYKNFAGDPGSNEKAEDLFSSPKTSVDEPREKIKLESTKATSMSNEKNRDQPSHFSSVSSLENYGSTKPSQFVPKKQSQASSTELLNESFDNYKDYKNLSEEGDSRAEERCMNHPNKRAKYFTMSEDELQIKYNLCSKCAVALADKGAKVKEIINSEEELRKSEIEAFLIKLAHSRKHSTSIIESMSIKKSYFIEFFNKQSEKAEAIASVLQKIISDELSNAKKSFEIQKTQTIAAIESFEQQLRTVFKEVEEMQSDIERNFENILKHIELTPFKKIIDSYYMRLHDIDQHLEATRGQKLEVGKLSSVKSKNIQEFKPLVQSFFELRGLKTSILKKMESEREDESPKTSGESSRQTNKSSLGISFENKDTFESGSVFESYREPDRFSFACDQSAIVKANRQIGEVKSPASLMSDNDNFLRTPLNTLDSPQTVSSRHAISNKDNDKLSPFELRPSIDDGISGVMRRSSCPSVTDDRIATANFERDSIVPLTKTAEKIYNALESEHSNYPLSAQKMKTSKNETKPTIRYQSENTNEEEEIHPPYDLAESIVRDSPNSVKSMQNEEKATESLIVPEKRPLKNPFARKKSSDSRQKNLTKSHNGSFNKPEDDELLPAGTKDHHEALRSPYFKELPNK